MDEPNSGTLIQAPIEALVRNPYQPRTRFDEVKLRELADSIRESSVIEPIVGRRHPTRKGLYEIAAGERRWRAAGLAQLATVPFLVRNLTDKQMALVAIVENIQRAELNAIEEAKGYKTLIEDFDYKGREVAAEVGKSESHISHCLRLLQLEERVQRYLEEGQLDTGHAKVLLSITGPQRAELAMQAVARQWTVRQLEAAVRWTKQNAPAAKRTPGELSADPNIRQLELQYSQLLGSPLRLQSKQNKWTITIQCSSLDELDGVLNHIK